MTDSQQFEAFMSAYQNMVFTTAVRLLGNQAEAEDVSQEVFLKAFTELGSYEGRGSMEGWLTRITTNTCLNLLRSSKRRPELTLSDLTDDETNWLDTNLTAEAAAQHKSIERSLIAADLAGRVLQTLPADDQLVLTLIDGEEASVKEVVNLTGWSESKVKVQAFRARRKMRQAVEKLLARGARADTKRKPRDGQSR